MSQPGEWLDPSGGPYRTVTSTSTVSTGAWASAATSAILKVLVSLIV